MRLTGLVLAVVFVTLALPAGTALPEVDPARPLAATALTTGHVTHLAWVPGAVQADSYVILAGPPGALAPISTVPGSQTSLNINGTYPSFAVASVHDGVTSNAVSALAAGESVCTLTVELDPPGFHDSCDPVPSKVGAKATVLA